MLYCKNGIPTKRKNYQGGMDIYNVATCSIHSIIDKLFMFLCIVSSIKLLNFGLGVTFYLHTITNSFKYRPKIWPLFWYWMPTLTHQSIDWTWTIIWRLQSTPIRNQLHHLLISSSRVWHITKRHHFPQQDSKRPGDIFEINGWQYEV